MIIIESIIAIAVLFFILSVLASGVNEAITIMFNRRSLELKKAIFQLLDNVQEGWGAEFYNHRLIEQTREIPKWHSLRAIPQRVLALIRGDRSTIRFQPSYINDGLFVDVLLQMMAGDAETPESSSTFSAEELRHLAEIRSIVAAMDALSYQVVWDNLKTDARLSRFLHMNSKELDRVTNDFTTFQQTFLALIHRALRADYGEQNEKMQIGHLMSKAYALGWFDNNAELRKFFIHTENVEALKQKLTDWFNGYMDRVSGWYKRHMYLALFWIGVILSFGLNLDAIEMSKRIFQDADYRKTLVALGEKYDQAGIDAVDTDMAITDVNSLGIRFTMEDIESKAFWRNVFTFNNDVWGTIPGRLLTAFAIAMGAPFWFEIFSIFLSIRGAGNKPRSQERAPASG